MTEDKQLGVLSEKEQDKISMNYSNDRLGVVKETEKAVLEKRNKEEIQFLQNILDSSHGALFSHVVLGINKRIEKLRGNSESKSKAKGSKQ